MTRYEYRNLNQGGLSDTKYQGGQNSVWKMVGCDVHSEPGIITVKNKLSIESAEPSGACVKAVRSTNGAIYFFTDGGDVYERTSAGVYSQVVDGSAQTPVIGKFHDAIEFNGNIYFTYEAASTDYAIGFWAVTTEGSAWASTNFDWEDLETENEYHPLTIVDDGLYIGNGSYIATYRPEAGAYTWTAQNLNIPSNYKVQNITDYNGNLIVGCKEKNAATNTIAGNARIFVWDKYSSTWSPQGGEIDEFSIDAFFKYEDTLYFGAGNKGNIYYWNGSKGVLFRKIPGLWTDGKEAYLRQAVMDSRNNNMLLLMRRTDGNPFDVFGTNLTQFNSVVYGFGGYSSGYNKVFTNEYIIAADSDIDYIVKTPGQLFFYEGGGGRVYEEGTDKFDDAQIKTRVFNHKKEFIKNVRVWVYYRSLPGDSDISITVTTNDGTPQAAVDKSNTKQKLIMMQYHIGAAASYQVTVNLDDDTSTTTNAPEVEAIIIEDNA